MAHDRVYALMGLASDSEKLDIPVDYSLTPGQVFAMIPLVYLKSKDLWFLTYCNEDPTTDPHFASWIPDWTIQSGYETIARNQGFRRWNASNDQATSAEYILGEEGEFFQLNLDGVVVDTIDWVSGFRPQLSQNDLSPEGRAKILAWISTVPKPPLKYRAKILMRLIRSWSAGKTYRRLGLGTQAQRILESDRKQVCWSLVAGNPPLPREDQKKDMSEQRVLTEQAMEVLLSSSQLSTTKAMKHRATCFFHRMMNLTYSRKVFRTVSGRVGLGSEFIACGDKVVIFLGAQTPFVVREGSLRNGRRAHKLVGEAYVDGIMEGEFFRGGSKVEGILLE